MFLNYPFEDREHLLDFNVYKKRYKKPRSPVYKRWNNGSDPNKMDSFH